MRRGVVFLLLLVAACGSGAREPVAHRVIATPEPTGRVKVEVDIPAATPKPRTAAPRVATAAPPVPAAPPLATAGDLRPSSGGLVAFRALGSWIDVFDYNNDPASILGHVKGMAKRGTKTLYLETSRYTAADDIQFPKALGAALDEAKARGMRVVSWYPPAFDDLKRDVRRSVAAVEFRSPRGNRFDAFASDIEYTEKVPDHAERNERVIAYTKKLRAAVGAKYPLAAIVIPPTSLEVNPGRWENFPWAALKDSYEVFMPMNYWTARNPDEKTAAELTEQNVKKTRALTGKPVHIIGGLGEASDRKQVAAYVKAARRSGSLGGGLYDYTTTPSDVWGELRKLN